MGIEVAGGLGSACADASVARMSDELLKAIGAKVRSMREARGASQEGFARNVGMDRAYMGKIERGTQNISLVTAAKIASALDVSLAELFDGAPAIADTAANTAD